MLCNRKSSPNLVNPPGRHKSDKGRGADCSHLVLDGVKGKSAGAGGARGVPLQRVVKVGGDEPHPVIATRQASCWREETMGELGQERSCTFSLVNLMHPPFPYTLPK